MKLIETEKQSSEIIGNKNNLKKLYNISGSVLVRIHKAESDLSTCALKIHEVISKSNEVIFRHFLYYALKRESMDQKKTLTSGMIRKSIF